MTSKNCPKAWAFTPSRAAWPEIKFERAQLSMEEFKTMVEGDWTSVEERVHKYYAEQRVRKEELEFMRGQDTRLTDLFNRHGSMTHRMDVKIHKEHPLLACLEAYCMEDVEAESQALHSASSIDYLVGHMRMDEDNEESPGILSDLEALTRDDGGVYPDGQDDPMAAIRSFCR